MYRIVVCPDCKDSAWIVNGTPDRTSCRDCGHTRKLQRLKQVETTEDSDEAKLILAQTKAEINDRMDEFREAYESGALTEEPNHSFDEISDRVSSSLEEELKKVDDRFDASKSSGRSEREIIRDAITEQDSPGEEQVIEYAETNGVDPEKTEQVLQKFRDSGKILKTQDGYSFL